ncbi:MAG: response regulator [Eubacteriales bacterium]|nr:response regulator [Eubacteriales bacterium]
MYKMILADDEPQILDSISHMLDWEKYNIRICGTAENGEEALNLMEKQQPEIMITDIRMPVMDGLELIEKVHRRKEECKVVVLSGYDDFEYVRTAMKNGAVDYLKKPLGRQEIIRVIEEIIDALEDEVLSQLDNEEDLKLSKMYFVNRLLQNSISPMEIREKQDFFSRSFLKGTMYIAVLSCQYSDQEAFMAYRCCERILEKHKEDLLFQDNYGNICLLFYADTEEEKEEAEDILDHCREKIADTLGLKVKISMGCAAGSWRELRKSYLSAMEQIHQNSQEKESPKSQSKAVKYVIEHTLENYMDAGLSLQTLAEEMGMNAAYLGRNFKKEMGKSYADYLNELRVEKAKELLQTTNEKGSQLSEKVGFTSYNYFYIVFKKLTGMKPTDVRR